MLKFAVPAALFLLIGAGGAQAQATRTWVSGVGDDANPCSRTAPCKTFAGAISKTAAGGEINTLDPGGFGAITITKSITIDGGGGFASILASLTNGVTVNGAGVTVTLRNLAINGAGNGLAGIRLLQGSRLHIENVQVFGFTGRGIDLRPSASANVFIRDTIVRENGGVGVFIQPGAGADMHVSLDNVRLDMNGAGVRAEDRTLVSIENTVAARNLGHGFHAFSAAGGTTLFINRSSAVSNSGTGLFADGANASIRMSDVLIAGNVTGIAGGVVTFGNNYNTGNGAPGTPSGSVTPQ